MAKKDEAKPETEQEKSEQKQAAAAAPRTPNGDEAPHGEVAVVKKQTPWPLITVGIFGTVLLFAAIAIAWLQLVGSHRGMLQTGPRYGLNQQSPQQFGGRDYSRSGPRGSFARPATSGVVTAVNGDTLTVSGSGKQVTVKTSDTTRISGDETDVAVNDTVIVYGTKNDDGSITATRIMIRNSAALDGTTLDESGDMQVPSA